MKLSLFNTFKSIIVDLIKSNIEEIKSVKSDFSSEDTISKTAINLTKSTDLQENIQKRLEIQREVDPLQSSINGERINNYRAEKKQNRKFPLYV